MLVDEGYRAALFYYHDPASAMQHMLTTMYSKLQVRSACVAAQLLHCVMKRYRKHWHSNLRSTLHSIVHAMKVIISWLHCSVALQLAAVHSTAFKSSTHCCLFWEVPRLSSNTCLLVLPFASNVKNDDTAFLRLCAACFPSVSLLLVFADEAASLAGIACTPWAGASSS